MEIIGLASTSFHGYTVYENGVILNKNKTVKSLRKVNCKGYPYQNFYYNGKAWCHLVHTFIWRAFNGPIPEGYEVDHIDNNRLNFRLDNLQLLTKSANNQKSYDSGNRKFLFGDTNPNSLKRKTHNGTTSTYIYTI